MTHAIASRRTSNLGGKGLSRVLPQIRGLIEASRQHVVSTANLTLVWLNWNVGRVIAEEIQQHAKRAEYGDNLIEALAVRLARQYGDGYSARSLWDMRRFFTHFTILPPPVAESGGSQIPPPVAAESSAARIRSAPPSKSSPSQTR